MLGARTADVNDPAQPLAQFGRYALMSQIQASERAVSPQTMNSAQKNSAASTRTTEPNQPFKALLQAHKSVAAHGNGLLRTAFEHATPAAPKLDSHHRGERKSDEKTCTSDTATAAHDTEIGSRGRDQEKSSGDESDSSGSDKVSDADLMNDPMARRLAGLACIPGMCIMQQTSQAAQPSVHSTSDLAYAVVDRFSFGAQGDRAVARLNIAKGPLAGASVTLSSEGRVVALDVSGLSPADEQNLRLRLRESLEKKGLSLES